MYQDNDGNIMMVVFEVLIQVQMKYHKYGK